MGRTVDDVLLLLRVLAAPGRTRPAAPGRRAADRAPPARPPAAGGVVRRPRRAGRGRTAATCLQRRAADDGQSLGWHVDAAEPDLDLAGDCFRVLRAWSTANSPIGRTTANARPGEADDP